MDEIVKMQHVSISQLFGSMNFEIDFEEHQISCLTGDNGVGKTTILKLIEGVLAMRGATLVNIPFGEISIEFDDGTIRRATRTKRPSVGEPGPWDFPGSHLRRGRSRSTDDEQNLVWTIEFSFMPGGPDSYVYYQNQNSRDLRNGQIDFSRWVASELPRFELTHGESIYLDSENNRRVTVQDIVAEYGQQMPPSLRSRASWLIANELEWIEPFANFSVVRIEANRLAARFDEFDDTEDVTFLRATRPGSRSRSISTPMKSQKRRLRQRIQDEMAKNSTGARQQDATFVKRLLDFMSVDDPIHVRDVEETVVQAANSQTLLNDLQLIHPEEPVDLAKLDKPMLQVLSLYYTDLELKNRQLTNFAQRLSLLRDIVNEKFSNKTFKIDPEVGFRIQSKNGVELNPDDLSSGEQHLLSLLQSILLAPSENSIFLIDEPEISLNIMWQQEFLSDLQKILGILNAQFIVATHSPNILRDFPDIFLEPTS